ncbi:hypothetical protein BDV09DRAFT_1605 [Aspergillus tetrazonus]
MSRNFIPVVLAVVMGVGTGYYTFQPALRELQSNKGIIARSPSGGQSLPAAQQPEQQSQQTVSTLTSTPTPTESNTGK